MLELTEQIVAFLSKGQSAVGLGILFCSSTIEYVFPPFPGDTITLFGAFLAANQDWSVPLVFLATTLGSLAGAAIDYSIGRRLGKKNTNELSQRALRARNRIEPILRQFRRYGSIYIMVNRFLPGIRALFFVAAGMSGLPVSKVFLWGAVSAAAWNTLIIAAGLALGKNWERLLGLLQTYTIVAWVACGVIAVLFIIRLNRQ
ncbi:MAG: DedA family protein [Proteobacteria bacterium]|nr:DedA family protein [Pseudomonadota bacterium]